MVVRKKQMRKEKQWQNNKLIYSVVLNNFMNFREKIDAHKEGINIKKNKHYWKWNDLKEIFYFFCSYFRQILGWG